MVAHAAAAASEAAMQAATAATTAAAAASVAASAAHAAASAGPVQTDLWGRWQVICLALAFPTYKMVDWIVLYHVLHYVHCCTSMIMHGVEYLS